MVAIFDHHYLSAQNTIQQHHWIRHRAKIRVDANKCLYIDSTKSYISISKKNPNFSGGHLGSPLFIGTKKIQCFHCIPDMRKPRYRRHNHASTLIVSKVMFNFLFHKILVMTILDLCKLEKFPKVATLARSGFGFWKP